VGNTQKPRHVVIGADTFVIDEDSDVPFRHIFDSVMVPRVEISGVPGAINLQRDIWLWNMSEFAGGEGRLVFDSGDPLGPPTYQKSDGGIDTRVPGEFSLHPDERLVNNETGGGSAPTNTVWNTTGNWTVVNGSPDLNAGPTNDMAKLGVNDEVRAPPRTPGAGPALTVDARIVMTKATESNKKVDWRFQIWNNTDSTVTASTTGQLKDNEKVTASLSFNPVAGKTYHYRVRNTDGGSGVFINLSSIKEANFATAPSSPNDMRDLRLGIQDDIWACVYDGANTDILRWNFGTGLWDQIVGNMNASEPRGMTGSDKYMYTLQSNGRIYRINGAGASQYAQDPATAGFAGAYGEPLGICVAANKLYALYQQGLFELTLDMTAGLPLASGADYVEVVSPGFFYSELSPDTTARQHIAAMSNGVRFFTNVRGEQATIWEFATAETGLTPTHMLPLGYVITAIRHYANITFIGATYTNKAALPAEERAAVFYISADNLLRALGVLRFDDPNSQNIVYINAYGDDVYFLQGKRIWRYDTGAGGLTLENEISGADETKVRAMARMDKKFWVAVEGQGTFVADDSYSSSMAYLTGPLWDFDLTDLQKTLLGFEVITAPLPSNTLWRIEYKLDENDWEQAGADVTTVGSVTTRLTVSTPADTKAFRTLTWRCGLASIDGVDTPRIRSITTRVYVLDYEESFDLTIRMDDDDSTNRLQREQISGRKKAERLIAYKSAKELVDFKDYYSLNSKKNPHGFDQYVVVIEDPFQELADMGQSSIRLKLKVIT
jgi:hypothetical protein